MITRWTNGLAYARLVRETPKTALLCRENVQPDGTVLMSPVGFKVWKETGRPMGDEWRLLRTWHPVSEDEGEAQDE